VSEEPRGGKRWSAIAEELERAVDHGKTVTVAPS